MTLAERIQASVLGALPGAEVTVQDMTGGGDHFQVIVLSPAFKGKTLIEQHQMVHASLGPLKDEIHALAIKTRAV
ncbi:MAG: BolA family transcriptional regulator [Candidatus Omnitrophica bacterium]|nr:BolA family transcriptional regulator [Candidatus Omnitrophota bacterium]